MAYQFQKHYTRDEAQALLPQVRNWLEHLEQLRQRLETCDERLSALLATGNDIGGATSNRWVRTLADLQEVLREFQSREIQLKDIERGLVDFPAIVGGREVFLCWEKDEETVEFWHDIDSGYAGRERL
jgi:hypothetical protein